MNEQELRQRIYIPSDAILEKRTGTERYESFVFKHMVGDLRVDGDRFAVKVNKVTHVISITESTWNHAPAPPPNNTPMKVRLHWGRKGKVLINPDDEFYIWEAKPDKYQACWFLWRKAQLTITDGHGKVIGHGIPPPTTKGLAYSGPYDGQDAWQHYRESAERWFESLGLEVISGVSNCGLIGQSLSDPEVLFYYALAHGDYSRYVCGSNMTPALIDGYMQNRTPITFAFIGHCGGMCRVGSGTFSRALRKGEMESTGTVGYCDMDSSKCAGAWSKSLIWQNKLFDYLSAGLSLGEAFEESIADYPECNDCMRMCGDNNLKLEVGMDRIHELHLEMVPDEPNKWTLKVTTAHNGIPVPSWLTVQGSGFNKSLDTGSDGKAELTGLLPGTYTGKAVASGYHDALETFLLAPY